MIHTKSSENSTETSSQNLSQNSSENSSKNSSQKSSQNSSSNEFLVSPVAYSYMYIQWEANETISHELIRNIGLTFATIAIVSLVLIMNLQVSTYISLFSQDLSRKNKPSTSNIFLLHRHTVVRRTAKILVRKCSTL